MDYQLLNTNSLSEDDYTRYLSFIPELKDTIVTKEHLVDRLQSACGYYIAKEMVAQKLGCDIRDLTIVKNSYGKPRIDNCSMFFSISHTDEYVVCIIDDYDVGIDIERVGLFTKNEMLWLCSSSEVEYICQGISEYQRLLRFCEVWTFKEAYLKLRGAAHINNHAISMLDYSHILSRKYIGNYVMTICSYHL